MAKVIKHIKKLSTTGRKSNIVVEDADDNAPVKRTSSVKVKETEEGSSAPRRLTKSAKTTTTSTTPSTTSATKTKKPKTQEKSKEKSSEKHSKKKTAKVEPIPEESIVPEREEKPQRMPRRRTSAKSEDDSTLVDRENARSIEEPMSQEWEYYCSDSDADADDFVGGYDFKTPAEELPLPDYTCLSPEEIIAAQKKQIAQISELLVISASNASNLLRHYSWRTEKLLARYFGDHPEDVMREAGLVGGASQVSEQAFEFKTEGECLVCGETVKPGQCTALQCKHRLCNDCWGAYLTMKVNEGEVVRLNCPAKRCTHVVPDEIVKKLVDEETYKKYLRFVTRSFVEDNTHFTWCPAPRCGNAITTDMLHNQIVHCTCGFRFCFSCHQEAHTPATCEQLKLWLKKCNDDSETGNWLGSNTKDCPRCQVAVEKNGGCNHMTCRQCTYEWCWMCIRPWKGHDDFYSCSRYEKSQKAKEKKKKTRKTKKQTKLELLEAEREAKKQALERYLTYYHKYLEYDMTLKQANEIRDKAQAKMKQLQTERSTLAEVKFIETATEIFLECQCVLKYSFVYDYYLEDDAREKHIFAFLKEDLQGTTKELAEVLDAQGILERRTEAVDLAKLAQTTKDNLLRGVENGLVDEPETVKL